MQPGIALCVLALAAMLFIPPEAQAARRSRTTTTTAPTAAPITTAPAPVSDAGSADSDGDGIIDAADNCIQVPNTGQLDTNADGFGNACDADLDNNGIVDGPDAEIMRAALGKTRCPDCDLNDNGIVNSQDVSLLRALFGQAPGPSGLVTTASDSSTVPTGSDTTGSASSSASSSATTGSYSTSFALTESPISEGGTWKRANNRFTSVRTAGGNAFGTNGVADGYDDSYALLAGFGPDQEAEAVIYRSAALAVGTTHEVELLLRFTDDSQNARGYECLFAYDGSVAQMRWDGGVGDFTALNSTGDFGYGRQLQTGDVVKATITGDTLRMYINGTLMLTTVDSMYATGQPGISFFTRPGGDSANFALSSYKVTAK